MYSIRFYADCPDGQQNKLFAYSVMHGGHAADLLRRFMANGFTIRAAFLVEADSGGKGTQLAASVLENLAWGTLEQEVRARVELIDKYPPRNSV